MNIERFGIGCLALTMSLALIGLASAQDDGDGDEDEVEAVTADSCFSLRQAKSMSALDDRHIYVETSGNRNYLLSAMACPGLRGAMGIAIRSREGDRVCGGGLASVSYRPLGGLPPTSCSINNIVSVQDKAEAESLAAR